MDNPAATAWNYNLDEAPTRCNVIALFIHASGPYYWAERWSDDLANEPACIAWAKINIPEADDGLL